MYLLFGLAFAMLFAFIPFVDAIEDCNITLSPLSNVKGYGYAPLDAIVTFDPLTQNNPDHQVLYEYLVSEDGSNYALEHYSHDDQNVGYVSEGIDRFYVKVIGYVLTSDNVCVAKTSPSSTLTFTTVPTPTNLRISGDLNSDFITLNFNGISNNRVGNMDIIYGVYQKYGLWWHHIGDYPSNTIRIDTEQFAWDQSVTLAVSACVEGYPMDDYYYMYHCAYDEYSNSVTVNRPTQGMYPPTSLVITSNDDNTINYSFVARNTGMWVDYRIEYKTTDMANFDVVSYVNTTSGTTDLPYWDLLDETVQFRVVTEEWTIWNGQRESTPSNVVTLTP